MSTKRAHVNPRGKSLPEKKARKAGRGSATAKVKEMSDCKGVCSGETFKTGDYVNVEYGTTVSIALREYLPLKSQIFF